ncbi:hsc70-interacting protein-like [Cylas formicarius]|uniref:hsc70-interacting protein-like n=1 Tax=Cylas formicarius TaxID=197179 RepID=UPI0029588555|nr:hsc70-interacting protein-like [Cylas formicarius]
MSCPIDRESLEKLKQFLTFVKAQPALLNLPQLGFFKSFIESFGGKVPEAKMQPEFKADSAPDLKDSDEAFESDAESELELDMDGCVEPDKLSDDQKMGDPSIEEVSEENSDKADSLRQEAMAQLGEGNLEKAIELFTEAIELNPNSAVLFVKRGQTYLKLTKPNACIKDCSRALELNPDSAASYKFRGRAYRLLGEWELAAKDLRQACVIDMDEQTDEWLKEVTPNAKKIEEHLLKKERKKKDKEERERLERIRKAREAHAKASAPGEPSEAGGAPPSWAGGVPGMENFFKLMQDPEVSALVQDPEVFQAFQDILKNPANQSKYESNPKFVALKKIIETKFGGGLFGAAPPQPQGDDLD